MCRIMIVDDEENILRAVRRVLSENGRDIETFSDPQEALRRTHVANFDVVISDYRMRGMDGVRFLSELKRLQPEAERIILSGHADMEGLVSAINEAEIFRFISKPWHDYDLVLGVRHALSHRAMLTENRRLADQVRSQRQEIDQYQAALKKLEEDYPGITKVNWGENGEVILGENDM